MSDQLSKDLASLRIDRGAPAPSRAGACLGWLVALVVLGAGGAFAYQKFAPSVFKTEVAVTEITLVSPAQASVELSASGYVVPQRQAKVSAKVLGRIDKMMVKEGDPVKEGAILYTLVDTEQRAGIAQARSRWLAAQARAKATRAAILEVRQQLAREKNLADQGVMPGMTAEDRQARLTAVEEQAHAADAETAAAADDLKAREVDLEWTVVRAPFDGIVLGKPLEVGELVGTFTEKPAVELADPLSQVVEVDVPEGRLGRVRPKGPCEIVLDAFPQTRSRGEVVELGARVNRAKGTVMVKVKFVDEVKGLLPDMAARVSFLAEGLDAQAMKEKPKLYVPREALAEREGAKVLFLIEEGRVRAVPVKVVGPFGQGFELASGPPAGTRVVSAPPTQLQDGMPVKEKAN